MKKWPLAWAAAGLTLAQLARRFSSPALPDPGPLPASVFGRLRAILLTHAHWDHMSGIPDFPGLPVMVTARDKAFFWATLTPTAPARTCSRWCR